MISDSDKILYALRAESVYDNPVGGKIIDRFQLDNENYVLVEFEKSPGVVYVFFAA